MQGDSERRKTGEADLHLLFQTGGAIEGSRPKVILRKIGRSKYMETPP